MKPGVELYNILGVLFDNGTEIMVSSTSPDAFRGKSINILFCDELAFVPSNMAQEFWAANYPTLSASTTSKIIIISTPNGMGNLYHSLYVNAEKGENGFA
jgi:phage FluMu gp28-like protein